MGQNRTAIVEPAPIIVIDEPYGRLRADVAPLLDFVVCIDLPLHIALARRLTRQIRTAQGWAENAADDAGRLAVLNWNTQMLRGFLDAYLDFGHRAYAFQRDHLLASCDLVVDGLGSVDEIVEKVADAVRAATT